MPTKRHWHFKLLSLHSWILFFFSFLRQQYLPLGLEEWFWEQHCDCLAKAAPWDWGAGRGESYLWALAPGSPLGHDAFTGTQKRAGLGFWGRLVLVAEAAIYCPTFTGGRVHTSVRQDHNIMGLLQTVESTFKIVMTYHTYSSNIT